MVSMMNKLAMINSYEIILEKKINIFAKNCCEIQGQTILVCTLYSIKYSICKSNLNVKLESFGEETWYSNRRARIRHQ
jgi:hypothetical protein